MIEKILNFQINIKLGRALRKGEHRVKVYCLQLNDPEVCVWDLNNLLLKSNWFSHLQGWFQGGGGWGDAPPPHRHENLRFLYGKFFTTRVILCTRILRSIDDNASDPPTEIFWSRPWSL